MKQWLMILMLMAICCTLWATIFSKTIKVGDCAPLFELKDAQGGTFSLQKSIQESRYVILIFYPKDKTSGCSTQLCAVQEMYPNIPDDITIVGISGDNAISHQEFSAMHHLQFPLLVDHHNTVRKQYGAFTWWLIPDRVTLVIDQHGIIVKKHTGMTSVNKHIALVREIVINDHR